MKCSLVVFMACALLLNTSVAVADWRENYRQALSNGNHDRALRIVQSEVDRNDPEAEFTLGLLYHAGQGVVRDDEQAHAWMSIAIEHGFRRGETSRKFVEEKLAPGQLDRAKKLADALRNKRMKH